MFKKKKNEILFNHENAMLNAFRELRNLQWFGLMDIGPRRRWQGKTWDIIWIWTKLGSKTVFYMWFWNDISNLKCY